MVRIRSLIIAIVIAALPAGFLYATLVGGRPLARDDASAMVYPIFHALDESLADGSLYLWDSQQWCGLPALAGGETTSLYPPTLGLCALLGWIDALHASYWLHLALAAAGVYWVARNLGASRGAGVVGAAAFAFSGYQCAHLIHFDHITALAHLPLMLAVLQTALVRNTPRWWALLAVEVALAALCSHPMLLVMALTVCVLWVIFGHNWRGDETPAYARLLPLLLAGIVAGLLVTPQLLPTLQLALAEGKASAPDTAQAVEHVASYPFRARDLVRVLLPNFFGTVRENILGGGAQWHETQPFTGAAPLLLGIAGAIVAFRKRGWGFCVATFAVGAALMPAEGNPIHAALAHLPFWGGFRATGRWMVLPILSLALLSALAITHLPEASQRLRRATGRAVGALAALIVTVTTVLWLTFGVDADGRLWLPGQGGDFPLETPAEAMLNCMTSIEPVLLVAAAIITWIVAARLAAGKHAGIVSGLVLLLATTAPQWHLWQQTNRTVPREYYTDPPVTAQALGEGRVTAIPPAMVAPRWRPPGSTRVERVMAVRELLTPALGTVWGATYGGGYRQGLVTPATELVWEQFYHFGIQVFLGRAALEPRTVERYGTPIQRLERLHALAGVTHIVTPATTDAPELALAHEGVVNVYTWRERHPRVWLAGSTHGVPERRTQLWAARRLALDPHRDVILDRAIDLPEDAGRGEAEIVEDADERLVIRAECETPGVLVVADAWYPGWSVTVDGEPAELLRANYAFRGVVLPEGEHEVVFTFRPSTWSAALPMCAVGLLVVIALLVWPTREPPQEGLTPPKPRAGDDRA